MGYKKCPRCELNWIVNEENYCDVCKAELNIGGIQLLEDDDEVICPVCKQNYLDEGEKMCAYCRKVKSGEGDEWIDSYDKDREVCEDEVDITSYTELEEKEWEEDVAEVYDDVEGFDSNDYVGEDDEEVEEEELDLDEDEFEDDFDDEFVEGDLDDYSEEGEDGEDEEEFEEDIAD